jgi:hypothetical protein
MNWIKYWFAVFIIELFIWSYVIILHFEIKELQKIRVPRPKVLKSITMTVSNFCCAVIGYSKTKGSGGSGNFRPSYQHPHSRSWFQRQLRAFSKSTGSKGTICGNSSRITAWHFVQIRGWYISRSISSLRLRHLRQAGR